MSGAILATGFPIGYCLAVIVNMLVNPFGWRIVFLTGILPALLVFFIRRNIDEPKMWKELSEKIVNPLEVFDRKYLPRIFIGFLLGLTMSLGIWGSLMWFPIWIQRELGGSLYQMTQATFIKLFAHAVGCYLTGYILLRYKRRTLLVFSYFFSFVFAFLMFSFFHSYNSGVIIFASLLGFSYGFIPAAFTIYFPELFPTRIRSTAEGFCYSTGRAVTALGVLFSGNLVQFFNGDIGRTASMMSVAFLIGALISLFAPETNKEIPLE